MRTVERPRSGGRRRAVVGLVSLYVCVVVVTLLAATTSPATFTSDAVSWSTLTVSDEAIKPHPAFRLGDAAKPFGWATAVADFNADGKPDFAVVDHRSRSAAGYQYQLELSVSGQLVRVVTFESTLEAVTVDVSDIDGDDDLDVLVTTPLSKTPIGVWLNDAHGHFTKADVLRFSPIHRANQAFQNADLPADHATFEAPRRVGYAIPVTRCAFVSAASDRFVLSREHRVGSKSACFTIRPRAPPPPSPHIFI